MYNNLVYGYFSKYTYYIIHLTHTFSSRTITEAGFPSLRKDITRPCHLAILEESFEEAQSAFTRALQWTKTPTSG